MRWMPTMSRSRDGKLRFSGSTDASAASYPRHVVVQTLSLVVDGRPDVEIDLTGDLSALANKSRAVVIKEGCVYRLRLSFKVQHEVVSGLRYFHTVYRKGIRVDKVRHMFGSYGPKADVQSARTPLEQAPSGMLARATYKIRSKFTDDDGNAHLEWDWYMKISKSW